MRHQRISFLAILLLCPCLVGAWSGTGHQIICLIAEDHLTPKAKAAITELLGDGVNISDAEVASWADEVRRSERRDTGDRHFTNIPFDASGFDPVVVIPSVAWPWKRRLHYV
jgi:hypothetical protein